MKTFTIGFTEKTAEAFFSRLRESGVKRIIDVRLNNVSQLAGFSKRDDLRFFLREVCAIDYVHMLSLAPTQDMLDRFKKEKGSWLNYEKEFLGLLESRHVERTIDDEILSDGCLLCSEHQPHRCHRRLVVEYLNAHGRHIDVRHLL